jgi:anti-sigma regulatory factor (Ser/Thr protein kinase)
MSALGAEPVSADGVAALRLVVSELVSNAVQHGTDDGVEVSIDVSDGEWLQVRVAGRGDPRFPITDVALWTIASSDGVSGRGLGIVRSLAHDVRAEVVDGVVSVHCRVRR